MTYQEAYTTLRNFQQWRLGNTYDANFSTKELTEALDLAIDMMERHTHERKYYCTDCKHLMPGNLCVIHEIQVSKPRISSCHELDKR